MSGEERKAYTTAVRCMLDSPSKSDPVLVPGARNRYDDFVAQHINQTRSIHGTGNFLTWVSFSVIAYPSFLTLSSIVSSSTLMRKHYEKNATTQATNHTGIGSLTRMI